MKSTSPNIFRASNHFDHIFLNKKRMINTLTSTLFFLSILLMSSCTSTTIFKDFYNGGTIGQAPISPDIGTAQISGDVRIVIDPKNDISNDLWIELDDSPSGSTTKNEYTATFTTPIRSKGGLFFFSYIPIDDPVVMSFYFNTPALSPVSTLFHIDLMPNGDIRFNDNTIVGSYKRGSTLTYIVGMDLQSSSPKASFLIKSDQQDVSFEVPIPASIAGFGLGSLKVESTSPVFNAAFGTVFFNDLIVTKAKE